MKSRRLWLVVPWALFIVVVAAWIVYWNIVAQGAETRVAAWQAAQRAAGAEASIGRASRHGFPIVLRLELDDVAYAPRRHDWRAHTPRVDLNINLLDPAHVIFQQKAPIVFEQHNATQTLTSRALLVSVHMDGEALREARLESDAPVYAGLAAQKVLLALRPDPRAAGDYQLAVDVTALHLAAPVRGFEGLGGDIETLRAGLVLHQAEAMLAAEPLEHWRASGGHVGVDGLALHWGRLETDAHGDVALDAAHRLAGALDADVPQAGPALAALAQSATLADDARQALRLAAIAFAHRSATLRFTAGDGVLRANGAPVRTLAPLY